MDIDPNKFGEFRHRDFPCEGQALRQLAEQLLGADGKEAWADAGDDDGAMG